MSKFKVGDVVVAKQGTALEGMEGVLLLVERRTAEDRRLKPDEEDGTVFFNAARLDREPLPACYLRDEFGTRGEKHWIEEHFVLDEFRTIAHRAMRKRRKKAK